MAESSAPGDVAWFPETRISVLRNTAIRLSLPFLLAFLWFSGSFLVLAPNRALILGGLLIAYMIPPSGKESIIPVGIVLGVPWYMMAASVIVMDVITGLFMILNLDIAFRIPYLGPWIGRFLAGGKGFLAARPWLTRWGVPGLAFFVLLPFQGTGGTGAPLVGWMMGLRWWEILLAIGIGASVEAYIFARGYDLIWGLLLANLAPVLAGSVILLIVVILIILFRSLGKANQED